VKKREFLSEGWKKERPVGRVPNFKYFLLALIFLECFGVILTQTCVVGYTRMKYTAKN